MAEPLTLQEKVIGKLRAVRELVRILLRLLRHPGDAIRLYQREALVSAALFDVSMVALEREFQERLDLLEARVAELEERAAAAAIAE